MTTRKLLPLILRQTLKLAYLRFRYPGRDIKSPHLGAGIVLGTGCRIAMNAVLGANVRLGDFSYVNVGTIVVSGTLGKFVSVGYYSQIGVENHPIDFVSTSPSLYGRSNIFSEPSSWQDVSAPPDIGNDVWIGGNCIVLQGVKIGDGAIVAANSLVNRDVPPYAIVGGTPAKVIRMRFPDEVVRELLDAQWWDLPYEKLASIASHFQSPLSLATLKSFLLSIRDF